MEGFRLSPQQERLWRLAGSAEAAAGYRAWCVAAVEGPLDRGALERALELAVERNELLRTSFRTVPGLAAPLQVPSPPGPLSRLPYPLPGRGGEEEALSALLAQPFDLAGGPLLRWSVLPLSPERHLLLLALPALLADTAGLDNLLGEIARCYAAAVAGNPLQDEPVQYVDLSEWQHELLESEDTQAGRDFWRRQPETPETPELPLVIPASAGPWAPQSLRVPLPTDLPRLAEAWGVPVGQALLAGWQALLWHLVGRPESLALAVTFAGRKFEELREAPGLFARDLPIQARLEPGMLLRNLAGQLHRDLSDVAEWQEYFTPAVGARDLPFAFEERPPVRRYQAGLLAFTVLRRDASHGRALARLIAEPGAVDLHYDSFRLPDAAARLLVERLATLLTSAANDPDAVLADLELVGPEERRLLLEDWNDTRTAFPGESLIHRLIENQAAKTPERIAVESDSGRWTYADLEARANDLARRLSVFGIGPEARVAVCLDRSLDMVAALLAIWKTGGAYIPLDPAYPHERLRLMLDDAHPALLLTGPGALPELAPPSLPILDLGSTEEAGPGAVGAAQATGRARGREVEAHPKELSRAEPTQAQPAGVPTSSDQLAYILYTSGSTGRPKGVMVSHQAIANRLLWMAAAFPLAEDDAVLQKTPFGFDASIWELFLPLLTGSRLVMAPPGAHRDPAALTRSVAAHGITVLQLVPSLLGPFLDADGLSGCRSLRRLFCGGELLSPALRDLTFARLARPDI
ncbi:MAG TPA: AMP-binding protein, partial [Thermoanaerobaculia bacterium]|nr:AMP-binding protein [Thermoanaerobaculia bacterium]